MRNLQKAFIAVFIAILLVPSVGMLFNRADDETMNMKLAPVPSLTTDDGAFNVNILADAGDWFADHFAWRGQVFTADAMIRSHVFGTSNNDQVVVGEDGWLYFGGTMDDYLGRNTLSARDIDNIAFNLRLVQDHYRAQGRSFVFTIAPNKNSLYAAFMPDNYVAGTYKNLDLLVPSLKRRGVNYVDLFEALTSSQVSIAQAGLDEPLYFRRDTHWNATGALVGYNALTAALGKPHDTYVGAEPEVVAGEAGDIDSLLYPTATQPEADLDYGQNGGFKYTSGGSVTDELSETESADDGAAGALYAYRDSFGNGLLPYLAGAYRQATFSKMVPYDVSAADAADADDVIVERAERHVGLIAQEPPIMAAPRGSVVPRGTVRTKTTVKAAADGDYLKISGQLDGRRVDADSDIYVSVVSQDGRRETFVPFRASSEDGSGRGYVCRLDRMGRDRTLAVTISARVGGKLVDVRSREVTWR